MSKLRPAHTTVLLMKRLADVENAAAADPMELVGLQDEFARVERKWQEQIAAGSTRRQPGDPARLDDWFDRLARQFARFLRDHPSDPAAPLLTATLEKITARRLGSA